MPTLKLSPNAESYWIATGEHLEIPDSVIGAPALANENDLSTGIQVNTANIVFGIAGAKALTIGSTISVAGTTDYEASVTDDDDIPNKKFCDDTYAEVAHHHDAAYAALTHNHDAAYSDINHNHNATYAGISHNHNATLKAGTVRGGRSFTELLASAWSRRPEAGIVCCSTLDLLWMKDGDGRTRVRFGRLRSRQFRWKNSVQVSG